MSENLMPLHNKISPLGFYDHFRAPDQMLMVGDASFMDVICQSNTEDLYSNFWVVPRAEIQKSKGTSFEQYFHTMKHKPTPLACMWGMWSHPQTPYLLLGAFTQIGAFSRFAWINNLDQYQVAWDADVNGIEQLWSGMAQHVHAEHLIDAAWLMSTLVVPEGLRSHLQQLPEPQLQQLPTDQVLVLHYLKSMSQEGGWMGAGGRALQAAIEHSILTSNVEHLQQCRPEKKRQM